MLTTTGWRRLVGSAEYPTTVISPSLDELHRGAQLMANGHTMPRMGLFANSPTALDPTMATAGSDVFSLEALYTPYALSGGWTGSKRATTLARPVRGSRATRFLVVAHIV